MRGESAPAGGAGEKRQVSRDSALNFAAAAATALLSALRAFLVPRLLPTVDAFGVLNLLNLFRAYSPYVDCGVLNGYSVEVPVRRGAGRAAGVALLENTAYTFLMLVTLLLVLVMLGMAAAGWPSALPEVRAGLLFFAGIVLLQNLLMFYSTYLRNELKFRLRSQSEALLALGFTAVAVGGVAWFGLYAVFSGLLLGELLALGWIWRHDAYRPRWGLSRPALARLMAIGLPMVLMSILHSLLFDIDLVLIKWYIPGYHALGLYGLGVTFASLMMMLPYTVGHALAPRIFREAGRPAAERDLLRYVRKPPMLMGGSALLLNGAAYLVFTPLVLLWLPQYAPGLPAMKLLLWYTAFLAVVTTVMYVFSGLKLFYRVIGLQLLLLALNVIANVTLLRLGGGITGVAGVTVAIFVLYAVATLVWAHRLCGQSWRAAAGWTVAFLLAFAYVALATLCIDEFLPRGAALAGLLGWLAVKLALYAVALLPLLALVEKRLGLGRELMDLAGALRKRG